MKLLLAAFFLTGLYCNNLPAEKHADWKPIEIGNYIFDFPPDFKLIDEEGTDSYAGNVKGDSIEFGFHFGYHTEELETVQEYLEKGAWKYVLSKKFMKLGVSYKIDSLPKVEVLNIRPATLKDSLLGGGCDYVARCRHDTTVFEYAIFVPEKIKKMVFRVDTINNQYRKIAYTNDSHYNGAEIYIRDLKSFNNSINSYLALSMGAGGLSPKQLQLVLEIFNTVRRKVK